LRKFDITTRLVVSELIIPIKCRENVMAQVPYGEDYSNGQICAQVVRK